MTMTPIFGIQLLFSFINAVCFGFSMLHTQSRELVCKYVSIGLGWHVHHRGGVLDFVYNELSRALHLDLGYEAGKKGMV